MTEPVIRPDERVKTTERLFSEEVSIARLSDGEDVLKAFEREVSYVFSNGRKFRNPADRL